MQEVLNRIKILENQVNEINLTLTKVIRQSFDDKKQNLEGYKKLAQAIEILSIQLEHFITTKRKE